MTSMISHAEQNVIVNREQAIDPEHEELLVKACTDSRILAKLYFPEEFDMPFSPLHDKIFEARTISFNLINYSHNC